MTQIPELPRVPFLGTVADVDPGNTHASFSRLADVYGDMFGFNMVNQHVIIANSHDVMNDLCDTKKFQKKPSGAALEVRNSIGDGLFTAFDEEENWGIAHRVLAPKFGPLAIQDMFHGLSLQASVNLIFTADRHRNARDSFPAGGKMGSSRPRAHHPAHE